jgi:hypothetical protein
MIYNLGAGIVIMETSFDPLHQQLNSHQIHQIYISGDKYLKFEHKRARIDQDTTCFVTTIFLSQQTAPMSTKQTS